MKIFILEDDLNRINIFRTKLLNHELYIADNVEEGKKLIEEFNPEVLLLDHDLGGQIFVSSDNPNTGYQFARWLREQGKKFTQIIIHSCNPVGANNIYHEIKNSAESVEMVPFPLLQSLWKKEIL